MGFFTTIYNSTNKFLGAAVGTAMALFTGNLGQAAARADSMLPSSPSDPPASDPSLVPDIEPLIQALGELGDMVMIVIGAVVVLGFLMLFRR
ncbi:MAG: hypothetical protein PHG93_04745 [Candidatus Methanomethylophilaceae archaeon]|nr:hypothetical protein [Candidatus Methanomethylophilaceae archaeon]